MKNIKRGITTKVIKDFHLNHQMPQTHIPTAGDVGVFEILSVGFHSRMQHTGEGNHTLFSGDKILATFGTRYATKVYSGTVPEFPQEEYQMLGRGGVIGTIKSANEGVSKPTSLKLLAYATDTKTGKVLNTKYYKKRKTVFAPQKLSNTNIILSIGSAMDSGKTTTAAYFCHGLEKKGLRTAYIKLTGTNFAKDTNLAADLGLGMAIDFSYFGYPSTYLCHIDELLNLYQSLMQVALRHEPDYVVIEIADGILQRETKMLLEHPAFMSTVTGVILSCLDNLGAFGGVNILEKMGIKPIAISGCVTASPMLIQELRGVLDMPVFNLDKLKNGEILNIDQLTLTN